MTPYQKARQAIDEIHSRDPKRTEAGIAAELVYADRMEAALLKLDPLAPELLRLAARCQHLERWSVPRNSYPMDKPGYHAWRKFLYSKQAELAKTQMIEAGVPETEAEEVRIWVSKTGLKTNAGTQSLEDAACLVFLQFEVGSFSKQHADYTEDKYIDILRKTWRKMSPEGQLLARSLELPPPLPALLEKALS